MTPMAVGLSAADIKAVASYLTPFEDYFAQSTASAGPEPKCKSNPPIKPGPTDWASLGMDGASSRFQPHPGLRAADVPRLKVKWAFTMSGGGQPTVVGDWLFVTNRGGKFYALDAHTGCVHWSVDGAGSRTTPMVIRLTASPSGWATIIGGASRQVTAYDAATGKPIWKSAPLDSNPQALLTGTPVVSGDKLFVPVSSLEEAFGSSPTYSCCTFRGSLAALDLKTGKRLWQTHPIGERLHSLGKNAIGTPLQGPAGGAIWSAPTLDPKRRLIYAGTGDSYTAAPTKGADAMVAFDMDTGKIRWLRQVTADDNFVVGCYDAKKSANCPSPDGPDVDFGASPVLMTLPSGAQVLVAGQKAGWVYGFNPADGKVLWKTKVGAGSAIGGIEWGIGADRRTVFAPNSDAFPLIDEVMRAKGKPVLPTPIAGKPGLTALDPASGRIRWQVPAPVAPCHYAGDRSGDRAEGACIRAQSAAPGVMPGVVFSGTMDGWLRAYDTSSGKILWAFSTTGQTYDTVNGVKGQPGGGIDGMGPTIADGMVFTMSGFNGAAQIGANGANVLLAFSVDGK